MARNTSIYKTEQYPASAIFQNHIDVIHGLFELYCDENKGYEWGLVLESRRIIGMKAVMNFLNKNRPDALKYYLINQNNKSELILSIGNGVSVNIKNGTHSLYGLFKQLMDACDSMSSPHVLVFLRRYWVLNLLIAGMMIPILIILLVGGGWWFLVWVVLGGSIEAAVIASLLDTSDWEDYILSTKINYDSFSKKTLSPLASIFGSTKAIISLMASLATIITFFIFLANQ